MLVDGPLSGGEQSKKVLSLTQRYSSPLRMVTSNRDVMEHALPVARPDDRNRSHHLAIL